MTCRKAGEHLSPYLDGELSPRHATLLEAHLAGCVGCRAELAGLRRAMNGLRTPPPSLLPEGLLAEFKQRLESKRAPRTAPVRAPLFPRLWLPAGVAATLLVAVIAGRAWWSGSPPVTERGFRTPSSSQMAKAMPAPVPSNAPPASFHLNDAPLQSRQGVPTKSVTPSQAASAHRNLSGNSEADARQAVSATATSRPATARLAPPAEPKVSVPARAWRDRTGSEAGRGERQRAPVAAPRKPRILLPVGVAEREKEKREAGNPKPPIRIAGLPRSSEIPPPPGTAGRVESSGLGAVDAAAPSAALSESGRTERTGWVAIRFVPRADLSAPGAFAPPAGETAAALQRSATDAAPAPAAGPGRQLAKRSASARATPGVPAALLEAMRREVNVAVSDVPLAELVARLGESARVGMALTTQVSADTMRVTADLRGLPLHLALAKLAEAAGLVIAPRGDTLTLAPRGAATGGSAVPVWSAEWGAAPRSGFAVPGGVAPKQ